MNNYLVYLLQKGFCISTNHEQGVNTDRNMMGFVTLQPRIGVFFADQETIVVDHIRKYQQIMNESRIQHGILITRNALSSQCRKLLNDSKLYIESFKESELVLNITNHILVGNAD